LVQALHGLGGVGKTQLAIEYAHLFAGEYQLVWWVDAERPELIGEQFSALAVRARWVDLDATVVVGVQAVMDRLRHLPRWLMVFDNVPEAGQVRPWLPQGAGHVVITSRSGGFIGLAARLEIDPFTRVESMALLRAGVPTVADGDADRLAEALGDLPLALAQAAGLLAETSMTVEEYLTELAEHAGTLLADGQPGGYPVSLAAAIQISVNRLAEQDIATVQLVELCASLAPEPIPLTWLAEAPDGALPDPLATTVRSRHALRRALGRLAGFGLARVTAETVQVHRLTQAVLRDLRTVDEQAQEKQRAEELVAAAEPNNDGSNPASWPAWAALVPHLLFLNPANAGARLRSTACNALWYLIMRAETRTVLALALGWHDQWLRTLSPDDQHVLWIAGQLAIAFHELGDVNQARQLHEDTFARNRRILGDEDPITFKSAVNLANDLRQLGDIERARQLDEDTLRRSRRILGNDHHLTLTSAANLAIDMYHLGEVERACELDQDTLARRRRVLGDDHPDTLTSAANLAVGLLRLGELRQARQLGEDTLIRRRRVLGDDHPNTLASATNVVGVLLRLGELRQARQLGEDTLLRARQVLGDDHSITLNSSTNLVGVLLRLGELKQARQLGEDTLLRARQVLGDDHPDTVALATDLAIVLQQLGHAEQEDRRWATDRV